MDKNTCPNLEERIAERWKSLEHSKYYFSEYTEVYPAVITEIKVQPCSESDCDIAFVFMVSNGFYRKKFYRICRHIFTDGKENFRNFYLSLMLPDLDYYSEEEYPELLQEIKAETDLNELLSIRAIVSLKDDVNILDVEDGYPCTSPDEEEFDPLNDWDFSSFFGGIISQIINTDRHDNFIEFCENFDITDEKNDIYLDDVLFIPCSVKLYPARSGKVYVSEAVPLSVENKYHQKQFHLMCYAYHNYLNSNLYDMFAFDEL